MHRSNVCAHDSVFDSDRSIYRVTLVGSDVQKLLSATGCITRVTDARGDSFVVRHPAIAAKIELPTIKQWFAVHKHGAEADAKQCAEQELQDWQTALRLKVKEQVSILICFHTSVACDECGCAVVFAQHCRKYCMLIPEVLNHGWLSVRLTMRA